MSCLLTVLSDTPGSKTEMESPQMPPSYHEGRSFATTTGDRIGVDLFSRRALRCKEGRMPVPGHPAAGRGPVDAEIHSNREEHTWHRISRLEQPSSVTANRLVPSRWCRKMNAPVSSPRFSSA